MGQFHYELLVVTPTLLRVISYWDKKDKINTDTKPEMEDSTLVLTSDLDFFKGIFCHGSHWSFFTTTTCVVLVNIYSGFSSSFTKYGVTVDSYFRRLTSKNYNWISSSSGVSSSNGIV